MKEIGIKYLTKKGYIIYYTIYYICSQFTYLYILPNFSTFTYSNCIQSLDAGAVEQVRIELSLGHLASVVLDELLNPVLSPHMRWLVGVCLKPFPPARVDIVV